MWVRKVCLKYTINIELHLLGYLYVMDMVNARKTERIKILIDVSGSMLIPSSGFMRFTRNVNYQLSCPRIIQDVSLLQHLLRVQCSLVCSFDDALLVDKTRQVSHYNKI
jgi:hypothetical protein